MNNFNLYSKYYDLLYNDKDYKSESEYVYNCLKKNTIKLNSLLELGCGSGGHAKYLIKKINNITGIDRSSEMVLEANKKNIKNFTAKVYDITNFSFNKKFDSIIALFHVISYLDNNIDLINCFNCVHKHLHKGGLFMFDFWYTPCVLNLKPEIRIKRIENDEISVVRIAEPMVESINNVVCVNFDVMVIIKLNNQIQKISEVHRMRHFTIPEIELLAFNCGFKLINKEEFITKKTPDDTTWGVSVIFKKI